MPYVERPANILDHDAAIFSLNFGGTRYKDGSRSFCYLIPNQEEADRLAALGWNVKVSSYADDEGKERYFLPVTIRFNDAYPTKLSIVSNGIETILDESELEQLDHIHPSRIQVSLSPYYNSDKGFFSAYLRTIYFHLDNDDEYAFDHMYDAPVAPSDELPFED